MRRRKIKSVQQCFRMKRCDNIAFYSIGLLDNTIKDLYAYMVLGYSPSKMQSVRKEMIAKNRHPGRKDKYKKKWQ